MIKQEVKYITECGQKFDSLSDAINYETKMKLAVEKKIDGTVQNQIHHINKRLGDLELKARSSDINRVISRLEVLESCFYGNPVNKPELQEKYELGDIYHNWKELKPFKGGKSVTDLGININRLFVLIAKPARHSKQGEVIRLCYDDNTPSPRFTNRRVEFYASLTEIAYLPA